MRPTITVIWHPRNDVRKWPREFDWICYLLRDFELNHVRDGAYTEVHDQSIVVVDGFKIDADAVNAYFKRFREAGIPVVVIHVGDEFAAAPVDFYHHADVVYRNYWRGECASLEHCHYFPLGPNCPPALLQDKAGTPKRWNWSFAGQKRDTRQQMIRAARSLSEGRLVLNDEFNSGLSKPEYAELLRQTRIVLSPRGWKSVECYRVYEALEAGAIPLVEDDGGPGLTDELMAPRALARAVCGGPRYWIDVYRRSSMSSYWQRVYGNDFPLPRIYRWENLSDVLDRIDIEKQGPEIFAWWEHQKRILVRDLKTTISRFIAPVPTTT